MKFSANAGALAGSLSLAATSVRGTKKGGPELARLAAADGVLSIVCSDLDISLVTRTPTDGAEAGECAVGCDRIARLVAGFKPDDHVTIATSETGAAVTCGRGRYRLPIVPIRDLPEPRSITETIAEIEIDSDRLSTLLEPLFCAGLPPDAKAGIFLHSVDGLLVAVATNGLWLCRVGVPSVTFSTDRDLILPAKPAMTLRRILSKSKQTVKLARSRTMISVTGRDFAFTSGLLDTKFPGYERLIPKPSTDIVSFARADLIAALGRLSATAAGAIGTPLVALTWDSLRSQLSASLARQPSDAVDIIVAETEGSAQLAVPLASLSEMIAEFKRERVRFEATDGVLVIHDEGDIIGQKLGLIAKTVWNFQAVSRSTETEAAA